MDKISRKEILLTQRRENHRPGGKMGNNKYTRKIKHKNKETEND